MVSLWSHNVEAVATSSWHVGFGICHELAAGVLLIGSVHIHGLSLLVYGLEQSCTAKVQ